MCHIVDNLMEAKMDDKLSGESKADMTAKLLMLSLLFVKKLHQANLYHRTRFTVFKMLKCFHVELLCLFAG